VNLHEVLLVVIGQLLDKASERHFAVDCMHTSSIEFIWFDGAEPINGGLACGNELLNQFVAVHLLISLGDHQRIWLKSGELGTILGQNPIHSTDVELVDVNQVADVFND
jgi:hypothetical protein